MLQRMGLSIDAHEIGVSMPLSMLQRLKLLDAGEESAEQLQAGVR